MLSRMEIGFDPAKSAANVANPTRGFGFDLAVSLDFENAMIEEDDRLDYGEIRYVASARSAAAFMSSSLLCAVESSG